MCVCVCVGSFIYYHVIIHIKSYKYISCLSIVLPWGSQVSKISKSKRFARPTAFPSDQFHDMLSIIASKCSRSVAFGLVPAVTTWGHHREQGLRGRTGGLACCCPSLLGIVAITGFGWWVFHPKHVVFGKGGSQGKHNGLWAHRHSLHQQQKSWATSSYPTMQLVRFF